MSAQSSGTVKWYNPEKAYGFITAEDGQDIFVHRNGIADGRPWLVDGQGVAFTLRQGMKGSEAAEVRVVQDVEEIPTYRQRLYESNRDGYDNRSGGYGSERGGTFRASSQRPARAPYTGAVPRGAVTAKVMRIDPNGRFLFAHADAIGEDVYVHGSLLADRYVQPGDEVTISIESSDRGLRARSLSTL